MADVNWNGLEKSKAVQEFITKELPGEEFMVCTEFTREKELLEHIKHTVWAFRAEFLQQYLKVELNSLYIKKIQEELSEDCNELFLALIEDFQGFCIDAADIDGYGHFLSPYDGEEYEVETEKGETVYIYRLN